MFELRKNLSSYKSPALRILVIGSIFVLMFYRHDLLPSLSTLTSKCLTVICAALICPCLLLIYISLIELAYVFKNKNTHVKITPKAIKTLPIEMIIEMLYINDIMEIEMYINNRTVTVGVSSNCEHNSSVFFDKKYYIGNSEYDSLDSFKVALTNEINDHECQISNIDGCSIKYYSFE